MEADVLTVSLPTLAGGPYVLVGKRAVLHHDADHLSQRSNCRAPTWRMYLVQKEVAERMAAPPGDKTYGALSVNLQAVVDVEMVRTGAPVRVQSAADRRFGRGARNAARGAVGRA